MLAQGRAPSLQVVGLRQGPDGWMDVWMAQEVWGQLPGTWANSSVLWQSLPAALLETGGGLDKGDGMGGGKGGDSHPLCVAKQTCWRRGATCADHSKDNSRGRLEIGRKGDTAGHEPCIPLALPSATCTQRFPCALRRILPGDRQPAPWSDSTATQDQSLDAQNMECKA